MRGCDALGESGQSGPIPTHIPLPEIRLSVSTTGQRPVPSWLITHSYEDRDAGVLKSGKEAEVFLVERVSSQGSCLLVHKRYRPRYPKKGELQELGFSKGTIYRADS